MPSLEDTSGEEVDGPFVISRPRPMSHGPARFACSGSPSRRLFTHWSRGFSSIGAGSCSRPQHGNGLAIVWAPTSVELSVL